jgi:uncharacterized membrane protein (UPF0136 family)
MSFVYELLVVLHLLGMAILVGGYLTVVRAPRIVPGMLHGALTQLVTGIAMVALRDSGAVSGEDPLDHLKIAVKLTVALVVFVLIWVNRRREQVPAGAVHAIGGLAVLNVLVAVLWQ